LLREVNGSPLPRGRAGVRHALRHPAFAELARDPRLLAVACEILGPNALPFHATLFDKSPEANWLVVWHQDTALPLQEKRESYGWGPWSIKGGVLYAHAPAQALTHVLALRVHLDNSTAENGPLRVLPRTHRSGVLMDDAIHELTQRVQPVECVVASGGVLVMRPLLVHASSKSRMDAARRVLHIEYASSLCPGDGLELATDASFQG
jgi:ectoine hydroxylase-related dioxygenase (phytanoyl-CoA dioxygenase family)